MNKSLVALVLLLWAGTSLAQHSHGSMKGPNGGPMQDVAGVHAELVVAGKSITINIYDESNKPVSAKGFSGSVLIVAGSTRATLQLAVAGDSSLKGQSANDVPAGAAVRLVLKNAAGKSGQVRF